MSLLGDSDMTKGKMITVTWIVVNLILIHQTEVPKQCGGAEVDVTDISEDSRPRVHF